MARPDPDAAFAAVATAAISTINLVPGIVRRLANDRADTEAWLLAFACVNLVLVSLAVRRFLLSPPGSAAERRARIAMCIHLLAIQLTMSLMVDRLYELIILWGVPAVALGLGYKMGDFDDK